MISQMVVDNGFVENIFREDGKEDNFAGDPFDAPAMQTQCLSIYKMLKN